MERLAKRMAHAGVCSRREAEKLILSGKVTVDGVVVLTPAYNVSEANVITVHGEGLPQKLKVRVWGFYKPVGLITTHKDPQGRPTVFGSFPAQMPRLISIGRLDLNSEGLLLLTTDGHLARYAELPTTKWPRYYRVRVFGDIDLIKLDELKQGITIEGIHYGRIEVEVDRQSGRNSWLYITLYEGKNREIRQIMRHLGLQVNRLIRVAYGSFQLQSQKAGDLWEIPYGEFAPYFPFLKEIPQEKKILKVKKSFPQKSSIKNLK